MLSATAVAIGQNTQQSHQMVPGMAVTIHSSRQLSEADAFEGLLAESIASSLPCCVPASDVRVRRRRRRNGNSRRSMEDDEAEDCDDYDVDIYVRAPNVTAEAIFNATISPEFIVSVNQGSNVSTSRPSNPAPSSLSTRRSPLWPP